MQGEPAAIPDHRPEAVGVVPAAGRKTTYARQAPYATCRFIASLGNPFVHAEVLKIVELHDGMTHATENLPLA